MSRWPMVPLGDVLSLALERHPVDPELAYPNIGIYSFARGVFVKRPIPGVGTSATGLYRVRAGQLIYSRLFAFEGAYAIVPDEADGCFVSNEFPVFDCRPSRVLSGYLRWLFSHRPVWRELASGSKGMGDRRQRVHPERVLAHRAPLPPLAEQRRIVARFDAVAERVARRRAQAEAVEAALAATLRAAFARVVADAPHLPLGDVALIVRRPVEIDPNEIYPELDVRSFGRGLFSKPDLIGGALTWQKLFRIEVGDLVFSNIKAWEGAFAVAQPEHHGRVGSHRYLTCVADSRRCTSDFLWYYLQSAAGIEQVRAASPGSADRNRTLSQKGLEAVPIPLPSLDAQRWFDALQAKAAAVRRAHAAVAAEVAHLLPALLHREFG